jgi:hypothetical protein
MSLEILEIILAVVGLPAVGYGSYQLLLDFPGILDPWRRGKAFRVLSTTVKVLIGEQETEMIKLRRVRAYRTLSSLDELDYVPMVDDLTHPGEVRPVKTQGLYSIPGTAQETQRNRIFVHVSEDEEPFRPLRDHNVVVGYMMIESIKDLWTPPELTAKGPVGSRLAMEVHLPPGRRFKRDKPDQVVAKVFQKEGNILESELNATIKHYTTDFQDGLGYVEWIRAAIPVPPKKETTDVILRWEWEEGLPGPWGSSPRFGTH